MYTIDLSSGQATKVLLDILRGKKDELMLFHQHNILREEIDAEKVISAINTLIEHYGSWR